MIYDSLRINQLGAARHIFAPRSLFATSCIDNLDKWINTRQHCMNHTQC